MAAIINKNHINRNEVKPARKKKNCAPQDKKDPLPDPAAVLDTRSTTIQEMMKPNSGHNLFYGEKNSAV